MAIRPLYFTKAHLNVALFICLFQVCAYSDADEEYGLSRNSLDDLLNMKITLASGQENALTQRSSPAIVTILTEKDIKTIGAPDLYHLLRYVAGYEFGLNANGALALFVRGNWGADGKVLILYNGVPINDNALGVHRFAGHFALQHIERIEIIRGPGAALHGGSAELGVINIVSKRLTGATVASLSTSRVADSTGYVRTEFGIGFGGERENQWALDFFAGAFEYDRTAGRLQAASDITLENAEDYFGGDSRYFQVLFNLPIGSSILDLNLLYGKEAWRFILWDYIDGDWYTTDKEVGLADGETALLQLNYRQPLFENSVLNTKLLLGDYSSEEHDDEYTQGDMAVELEQHNGIEGLFSEWYWKLPTQRREISMELHSEPFRSLSTKSRVNASRWSNFLHDVMQDMVIDIGVGSMRDQGDYGQRHVDLLNFWNTSQRYTVTTRRYKNDYIYFQTQASVGKHTLTLGARHERHEEFGEISAPRFAFTSVYDIFHWKLLLSRAFKAPQVITIGTNPELEPEKATVQEIELGWRIGSNIFTTVNLYNNHLEKFIVYYAADTQYINGGEVETEGVEWEWRYMLSERGFAALKYSYYRILKNDVEQLSPWFWNGALDNGRGDWDTRSDLIGTSDRILAIYGGYQINDRLSINSSLRYFSDRWEQRYRADERGEDIYVEGDEWVVNIHGRYKDLWMEGVELVLGVNNITDADNGVPHGEWTESDQGVPGLGRRVLFELNYEW